MARSVSARALVGAAVIAVSVIACGSSATGAVPPATPVGSPVAATTAPPSPSSSPSTGQASTFDTTTLHSNFDLPMTVDLPADWITLSPPVNVPKGTFNFVHTGSPADDESQWWGPAINLVAGAWVADPAGIDKPAGPGDALVPWPASYVDYLASLPGVTVVEGPSPVTIGGVDGRRVVVTTPAMHPTVHLKGDTGVARRRPERARPGHGARGHRADGRREAAFIIEYDDAPQTFDEHRKQVDEILQSITFPTGGPGRASVTRRVLAHVDDVRELLPQEDDEDRRAREAEPERRGDPELPGEQPPDMAYHPRCRP